MTDREKKIKVGIVGTNGVPAAYGGFETLADNLVRQLGTFLDITVYCSKTQKKKHYQKRQQYSHYIHYIILFSLCHPTLTSGLNRE